MGLSCLPRQRLPPNGLQIGGVGDEFNLKTSPPCSAKGNGMSATSEIDTVVQIYGRRGGRRPHHSLPGLPLNVKTNPSPVLLQNLNHQERQGQLQRFGMLAARGMGGRWGVPCICGGLGACPQHGFRLPSSGRVRIGARPPFPGGWSSWFPQAPPGGAAGGHHVTWRGLLVSTHSGGGRDRPGGARPQRSWRRFPWC